MLLSSNENAAFQSQADSDDDSDDEVVGNHDSRSMPPSQIRLNDMHLSTERLI
jgi:hypothetical protein